MTANKIKSIINQRKSEKPCESLNMQKYVSKPTGMRWSWLFFELEGNSERKKNNRNSKDVGLLKNLWRLWKSRISQCKNLSYVSPFTFLSADLFNSSYKSHK